MSIIYMYILPNQYPNPELQLRCYGPGAGWISRGDYAQACSRKLNATIECIESDNNATISIDVDNYSMEIKP